MKITPYRSTNNYQDKNSKSKTFNSQHSPSQIFSSMHLGADTPVFMFQAGGLRTCCGILITIKFIVFWGGCVTPQYPR